MFSIIAILLSLWSLIIHVASTIARFFPSSSAPQASHPEYTISFPAPSPLASPIMFPTDVLDFSPPRQLDPADNWLLKKNALGVADNLIVLGGQIIQVPSKNRDVPQTPSPDRNQRRLHAYSRKVHDLTPSPTSLFHVSVSHDAVGATRRRGSRVSYLEATPSSRILMHDFDGGTPGLSFSSALTSPFPTPVISSIDVRNSNFVGMLKNDETAAGVKRSLLSQLTALTPRRRYPKPFTPIHGSAPSLSPRIKSDKQQHCPQDGYMRGQHREQDPFAAHSPISKVDSYYASDYLMCFDEAEGLQLDMDELDVEEERRFIMGIFASRLDEGENRGSEQDDSEVQTTRLRAILEKSPKEETGEERDTENGNGSDACVAMKSPPNTPTCSRRPSFINVSNEEHETRQYARSSFDRDSGKDGQNQVDGSDISGGLNTMTRRSIPSSIPNPMTSNPASIDLHNLDMDGTHTKQDVNLTFAFANPVPPPCSDCNVHVTGTPSVEDRDSKPTPPTDHNDSRGDLYSPQSSANFCNALGAALKLAEEDSQACRSWEPQPNHHDINPNNLAGLLRRSSTRSNVSQRTTFGPTTSQQELQQEHDLFSSERVPCSPLTALENLQIFDPSHSPFVSGKDNWVVRELKEGDDLQLQPISLGSTRSQTSLVDSLCIIQGSERRTSLVIVSSTPPTPSSAIFEQSFLSTEISSLSSTRECDSNWLPGNASISSLELGT